MQLTWLGWAGFELEHEGATVVIDALDDARAVFAPLGERAAELTPPEITAPQEGRAVAGLVSHLHRDHADATALSRALTGDAVVFEPPAGNGEGLEELSLAQAEHELNVAGLTRRRLAAWEQATAGPFTLTALPAADGTGDPQVAWLVEAGGVKVLHLGDTMFHGWWWRMALRHGPFDVVLAPVNAAVVDFPHRQPASDLPIVMDPLQAANAAHALQARLAIPMHDEGYAVDGLYAPTAYGAERFVAEATAKGVRAERLALGETLDLQAERVAA